MCVPLALGYVLALSGWKDGGEDKSLFSRLIESDNFFRQITLLFLTGIMLLALVFSKSRMGIISVTLALVFFYIAYFGFKRERDLKMWMGVFILAVAVFYGL